MSLVCSELFNCICELKSKYPKNIRKVCISVSLEVFLFDLHPNNVYGQESLKNKIRSLKLIRS